MLQQTLRRKVDDAQHAVRTIASAGGRRLTPMPTYWWDTVRNFGDHLVPLALRGTGLLPYRVQPEKARLFAVGSILKFLPPEYDGFIWGSGAKSAAEAVIPASANVLALRGHLTAEAAGVTDVALGDPGLLAPLGMRRLPSAAERERWGRIALIPHLDHRQAESFRTLAERLGAQAHVVDTSRRPETVIRLLASSAFVVSSSLHGMVIADALGIPAFFSTDSGFFLGGRFKLDDYQSVVEPSADRVGLIEELRNAHDVKLACSGVSRTAVARSQKELCHAITGVQVL